MQCNAILGNKGSQAKGHQSERRRRPWPARAGVAIVEECIAW